MKDRYGAKNPIIYFFVVYALTYMTNAIYSTFMPVYLEGIGYSQSSVRLLLALGPFVAIIGSPVWGMATDRARTKNTILKILLIGNAAAVAFYPLSANFLYIMAVTIMFTFFQTSINPMSDAVTLEYLENSRYKFGPVRMSGTIGYAVMAVIAGILSKRNINYIFILYFAIAVAAFAAVLALPEVKGHQTKQNKVPVWKLLKNRELVVLMSLGFIMQVSLFFYSSFFPIYYKQLGADNGMLGWAAFLAAASEIPFLFFADRILNRIGVKGQFYLQLL